MNSDLLNNRYRIIKVFGSGGFGNAFLAEDIYLPSVPTCIIKQLKKVTNDPEIARLVGERFAREAAILENLGNQSDRIPKLYAYFAQADRFYLVQEFIAGDTLTNLVKKQGPLSSDRVREILIDILPILDFIHSRGILHRDLKPDNIILRSADNKSVLIDFGAVREIMNANLNEQGELVSSIAIGTPGFMPPEQAAGRPLYSSDLYSLALTAIYLLTGKTPQQLPIHPNTGDILWYDSTLEIESNLAIVLDQAISFNPEKRFSSASEMLAFLAIETTNNSPTIPISQQNKHIEDNSQLQKQAQTSKHKKIPILAGGISLIIFGLIVGVKSLIDRAIEDKFQVISAEPTPEQEQYYLVNLSSNQIIEVNSQIESLQEKGYKKANSLALTNYPNLPDKTKFVVYINSFSDRASCYKQLQEYSKKNLGTYCFLGSTNPEIPTDRFYSDYAWLSETKITEANLQGRTPEEISIMRNSILARRGRRFVDSELQKYFNNQPWYHPNSSPKELLTNLLSPLERQNISNILQYEKNNNWKIKE
jgi:serine/threonine-protein kinase